MDNPFRYGEVATGEYFTDRSAELAELEADIRSGQNVVIISPRRYGKTSLIFEVAERLKRDHVLVAYLDLFRTPTKDRLADHLADAIHDGLVAPLERVRQRAVDMFQKLPIRPRITLNPDGTPSFEFSAGERTRDLDRTLEQLLELPQQIAQERKRRVALVIDEFQEVVSIDPELKKSMRAVFQAQPDVAHVFLGSKRHLMERVFGHVDEPLYRLAKPMPLLPIRPDDFAAFVRDRFATTGVAITAEAVERILAITEGHPHDTQELCYFTWALAHAAGGATGGTVERALDRVLDAEDARYTVVWEQLSAHQRLVLAALVAESGAIFSEAYRRAHRLGSAASVQRSLGRLVERELVELGPERSYRVSDVFLRAWVARATSPSRQVF